MGVLISLVTLLLLSPESDADDKVALYSLPSSSLYATAAVGVFNSGKQSTAESKYLGLGYRDALGYGLTYQYEVGGWTDIAKHGRKGSAYGTAQIGVEADAGITIRAMVGPALISTPDAYLGGTFQFNEDFYAGIRGANGNTAGFKYKHISNAGIMQPNVGRDFAGLEVGIPF